MRTALPVLTALAVAQVLSASGPMGHFIKSSHTVRQITSGQLEVPKELKDALKDPECQRAFNGGAIGPDLVESKSHYGNTGDLSRRMLESARENMKKAAHEGDQDGFDEAKKELAFAYGWLHHCAADLNTHPKVNERVGDSYRFLDKGGKLAHGAMEGQETTYLKQTLWNPEDKYDVFVPFRLLAKHTGVSAPELINMNKVLKAKAAAELFETGKVTLSHEELKRLWETTVRGGQHEAAELLKDPSKLKNWDLDCGHLSTEAFDALRKTVMDLNGGTLPAGWGKNYLAWYEAVKGLPREQMLARLRQLMGLASPEPKPAPVPPPSAPLPSGPNTTSLRLELPGYWGHLGYTISGAQLNPPTGSDRGKVGGRQYTGKLVGSTLTVSGTAVSDNESSGPGSGDYYELIVEVVVGKEKRYYGHIAARGERLNRPFNLSLPIDPEATSGHITISLLEQNARFGPHGWVVTANLTR